MITRRYLEKESTVLGLPMMQVGMLVLLMVVMIVFSTFLKMVMPGFKWFNHATVITLTLAYMGLKYASKKKHPSFITSQISFHLQQKHKRFLPKADSIVSNHTASKYDISNHTDGKQP